MVAVIVLNAAFAFVQERQARASPYTVGLCRNPWLLWGIGFELLFTAAPAYGDGDHLALVGRMSADEGVRVAMPVARRSGRRVTARAATSACWRPARNGDLRPFS